MEELNLVSKECWVSVFFVFGLLLGSFANVVIFRWMKNLSIIRPRSFCYQCKKQILWYDNIPVLSWINLRGKCRNCGNPISFQYPLVEFIMAVLFAASYYCIGFQFFLIETLLFIFSLVVCSFIDLEHMILPDEFTLSGIVIGLVGALVNPERHFLDAILGVLLGGGFLWAVAYVYFLFSGRDGMGGGDIKLLAWIGALLGWKAIPFVIMSSAILGSIVGMLISLRSKDGLKTAIPFGPYLAFSAVFFLLGGESVSLWYFSLFLPGF